MRVRLFAWRTLLVLLGSTLGLAGGRADASNSGFVHAQGTQFVLNGQPFRFVGTNAYYMAIMTALGSPRHADDQIALARALGFTVMRTWGYADGPNDGVGSSGFQPGPGVYNESAFRALDYVLHKADLAGIRLIIPFVDGNSSYGGVGQYIRWCAGGGGERVFYEHTGCKDLYKRYVTHVVTRINTYNGRRYKDDPTILAWELANEPHIVDSVDRSGQIVRNWVREMAAFVKFRDPNHMVATGEEGYDVTTAGYSPVTSAYNGQSWLLNGHKGLAWTQNTSDPNIDYGSIHLYPEFWLIPAAAGRTWIADHIRIARSLGKPLVLGEFGASSNTAATFESWLQTWDAEAGDGALAWQVMCQVCYGMRDQFGIAYPPANAVTSVLARYADRVGPGGGGETPDFTVGGVSAAPSPARVGQAVTLAASVTATGAASGIVVDLEVHNAAGQRIAQQIYGGQTFAAGQTRAYAWNWSGTQTAGSYRFVVAVSNADGSTVYTVANPAATFAVQVPATLAFTVGATSASPSPVLRGQTLAVATSVTAATAASGIIVDIGIWNAAGTRVVQRAYTGQGFSTGQRRTYSWPWVIPATLGTGTYRVSVGVFDASWTTPYRWIDQTATFTVQAPLSFAVGSTTASPNPVNRGQTMTVATAVTASGAASGIIVEIGIWNAAGTRVVQRAYTGQGFSAGQRRTYSWPWVIPATLPPGTYRVSVSVFNATRMTRYRWINPAATFTVR